MAKAKLAVTFPAMREATRVLYAGVGVNDLAVGAVRDLVATAQKSVQKTVQESVQRTATSIDAIDLDPRVLRERAVAAVSGRVEAVAADAKARRRAVEARATELVRESIPAYGGLVQRGQTLVGRIRKQESTVAAATSAGTTVSKARTTRTQATKTAAAGRTAAKKSADAARRSTTTARKRAATTTSSARATVTSARRTASETGRAFADAAQKVGD
jgi:heparin binding hemagglutinin HbhA